MCTAAAVGVTVVLVEQGRRRRGECWMVGEDEGLLAEEISETLP